MFEDFSFCLSCEQYDQNDRLCKLFDRTMVAGCPYGEERKPRNHFEMLKAMSMEEMADFLGDIIHDWGEGSAYLRAGTTWIDDWLDWLKEDVDGKAE